MQSIRTFNGVEIALGNDVIVKISEQWDGSWHIDVSDHNKKVRIGQTLDDNGTFYGYVSDIDFNRDCKPVPEQGEQPPTREE